LRINRILILIFLTPISLVFLLIYVLPIIHLFATSFTNYNIFSPNINIVGLSNYIRMIDDNKFNTALRNTLIWILIQTTVQVALGVYTALVLYTKPRGWKLFRTIGLLPHIIPTAALSMIFLNIFNPRHGLLNRIINLFSSQSITINWLSNNSTAFLSITMSWLLFFGITTMIILNQALSIDENIIEASKLDGANIRQINFYILIPILKKNIGITVFLSGAFILRLFDIILLTTNGGPGETTLNLAVYLYKVFFLEKNYGYANALGVIIVLLGIIFSFFIWIIFFKEKIKVLKGA